MAVIGEYRRSVLPQGGIADVRQTGAQALSQGLQQIGQAGGSRRLPDECPSD